MSIRDLIPWNRQESRLPVHTGGTRMGDGDYPLLSLHREMNRLFDDALRNFGAPLFAGANGGLAWPQVEFAETDKEVHVTAELPGLSEKDVEIIVEDNVLTLRGEKKSEIDDKDRGYTERSYGRFERRIALPRGVDQGKASATFKNGVLTVTLPRTEAARENVRRIPVNAQNAPASAPANTAANAQSSAQAA